jgi:hypothetical protein
MARARLRRLIERTLPFIISGINQADCIRPRPGGTVVFPPVLLGLMVLAAASLARRRASLQQVSEFPDLSI